MIKLSFYMYAMINYVIAYRHIIRSGKTQREEKAISTYPEPEAM